VQLYLQGNSLVFSVHEYSDLQKHSESIAFHEIERHSSLEFERLMLSYIQNGQTANLMKRSSQLQSAERDALPTMLYDKKKTMVFVPLLFAPARQFPVD